MALILADRVRETSTTTGTGTFTLAGAVASYQSFSAIGDANTTYYTIVNQSADEWEVGIGTYTSSGTTLSRDTILASSNAGSLVNFSAGTKDVWGDYPAGKAVTTDTLAYPPAIGGTTPAAATFTTLTATGQANLGGDASLPALQVSATSGITRYCVLSGSAAGGVTLQAQASGGNPGFTFIARGSGVHSFSTNGTASTQQFQVSHTTSAVNYVQVTGAATGGNPTISALGSDATQQIGLYGRGTGGGANIGTGTTTQFATRGVPGSTTVNFLQANASTSGNGLILSAVGSDTNISQVFLPKGTGAIDLAAGSSGVNISNGGTVTAITLTSAGSNYTSAPTVAISAPTTAGGVQATATIPIMVSTATVSNGGTGYTVNDVLTVSGGTFTTACQLTVSAVSGGVITAVTTGGLSRGSYTVAPANPASVTGGTGTGATFTLNFSVANNTTFTITNAGSGYVEQPTVSFSGGGGSGAAAYATVGSGTTVRSLGSTMDLTVPSAIGFRVNDIGGLAVNYWQATNAITANGPTLLATGSDAAVTGNIAARGAASLTFRTNSTTTQFNVAHTASAVNYVQVTGNATGSGPIISSQGSDTNVDLLFSTKGTAGSHVFRTNSTVRQFQINHVTSAVNYGVVTGSIAGAAVPFSVAGSDTNIDLALTPKGTGLVRFGTYTSLASTTFTIDGYIEIKDSAGNVKKLAVIV